MINFYFKLIEERSKTQSGLPTVLALETFFLNILERESEKNFTRVSPFAKKGEIFTHDIVLMPMLHDKHFSLYVSICNYNIINYISNNIQYQ